MSQLIRNQDIHFLLYDFLKIEQTLAQFSNLDYNREIYTAVMETAEKIANKFFLPHNEKADKNEPQFIPENQNPDNENYVKMIPEVKTALEQFSQAGFIAARHPENKGGMNLPATIMSVCQSYFFAANPSTSGYVFLTTAAANIIEKFGTEKQQHLYLEKMLEGKYFGTMALTEPDVGSSLGDIKTSAEKNEDQQTYLIKGQKMFISGGDHHLSDNIIHLVLARIKGSPSGVKGLSLFIVPKFLINEEHQIIRKNDVNLGGLLHKMGYRGTTSTILNFGENNQCTGFLIGSENQGLRTMFAMMNEARIGVGLGAAAMGYRGFLYSLDYARQRKQGRAIDKDPLQSDPISISEHPDVKRMLLQQKSYVEGSMALCLYASLLVDQSEQQDDKARSQQSSLLLDLLTPVVKSFPSKYATRANDIAIQVLGGSGYTKDYPLEQLYRDNRLNPIHEGTEGIQALDLLGRKLWIKDGQALKVLFDEIFKSIQQTNQHSRLLPLSQQLQNYLQKLQQCLNKFQKFMQDKSFVITLGNASLFLDAFSIFVVSWQWLQQAESALVVLNRDHEENHDFLEGKLSCARFYLFWELPKIGPMLEILENNDDCCYSMNSEFL